LELIQSEARVALQQERSRTVKMSLVFELNARIRIVNADAQP
jgi:hypothetical protein